MVFLKLFFLGIFGLGMAVANPNQATNADQPLKVLFIGNSLTFQNDLPGMIKSLAGRAAPPLPLEVHSSTFGGATLERHWEKGDALKLIQRGGWSHVVVQGQSLEAITNKESFFKHARLFDDAIRKSGAKTVLYMTWALQKAPQEQKKISDAYRGIGKELAAQVVPVGDARELALKDKPGAAIYSPDGKHPSPQGTYLAACLFYGVFSGQSPKGLPGEVPALSNPAKMLVRLDAIEAAFYQDIAWKAVLSESGK